MHLTISQMQVCQEMQSNTISKVFIRGKGALGQTNFEFVSWSKDIWKPTHATVADLATKIIIDLVGFWQKEGAQGDWDTIIDEALSASPTITEGFAMSLDRAFLA